MDTAPARASPTAFLPDASNHRTDPAYLQHLLAKTELSERAAERLLGLGDRSLRNFMQGKSRIPYMLQFCMEVLARSGTSEPPRETGVWFFAKQRPLRDTDAGRLIIARVSSDLRFGRVEMDGYGVTIHAVPGMSVDGGRISANVVSEYVLVDGPQS